MPGETMSARPFNAAPAQKIRWKYNTGTTVLAAPTVGVDAVIVPSNDHWVHAMQRGPTGGPWPTSPWGPRDLGDVAQHRAPVIPLAAGSRAFIATQDGKVHAIDTTSGNLLWTTPLPEGATLGAPAGIFGDFGGDWNYVLVGTSSGTNDVFYALDPVTGAVVDWYPGPGDTPVQIGAILGMASVDYDNNRVYFASQEGSTNDSVWCLNLGPPGHDRAQLRVEPARAGSGQREPGAAQRSRVRGGREQPDLVDPRLRRGRPVLLQPRGRGRQGFPLPRSAERQPLRDDRRGQGPRVDATPGRASCGRGRSST